MRRFTEKTTVRTLVVALLCCLSLAIAGCGQPATESAAGTQASTETEATPAPEAKAKADLAPDAELADGEYEIAVDTDSSMFRCETCTLVVEDGEYTARLSLPGEGFSRLYFGTAEEAAEAAGVDIYDYYLNDAGLYTFDVPVEELEEELPVAAFGHRRDTWYDHTITFHAPTA